MATCPKCKKDTAKLVLTKKLGKDGSQRIVELKCYDEACGHVERAPEPPKKGA